MTNLTRRGLMQSAAAVGLVAASGLPLRAAPRRGGHFIAGLSGANTSDSWDGRTHSDLFMTAAAQGAVFDSLTMVAADGTLEGELAESWESSPDARTWTFNLRKGVKFHNGKDFGADDVIESLNLHVAEGAKSGARPIVENIDEMRKITDHQIQFVLKAGNADFPYLLSDYHILIYPAGQIEEAIARGIGTGLYRVESFDPGVRFVGKRVDDHYKGDSAGFFDSIEFIAINDDTARTNALLTGQVHAINRVDLKTEPLLKANPMVEILEVTGNQHYTFPMLTDVEPFTDNNVRLALKHAVNRQELVDKILLGHGRVSWDNPIGPANRYFHEDLEPNPYDPDKARFHLGKAGLDSLEVELSASDAAFSGAVDAAQLYAAAARPAGITIKVVREPADGYWSNVWLKKPWCASYWSGRATEDWMFSTAYQCGVPWNDSHWCNERFDKLLMEARVTLDPERRREIYHEMQRIVSKEGGVVIPMYANYVQGKSVKIATPEKIGNLWQMDNARMAERWWFA